METHGLGQLIGDHLHLLPACFTALDQLVTLRLPSLSQTFERLEISSNMYATPWFITLFSNFSLIEENSVVKLWDLFLVHGLPVLLRVSVAILQILEPILNNASLDMCITILNGHRPSPKAEKSTKSWRNSQKHTTSSPKSTSRLSFRRQRPSVRSSADMDLTIGQMLQKLTAEEIIKHINKLNITDTELFNVIPELPLPPIEQSVEVISSFFVKGGRYGINLTIWCETFFTFWYI